MTQLLPAEHPRRQSNAPRLPPGRGPVSERLRAALTSEPRPIEAVDVGDFEDPLADEDLQLSLYLCYELHYRGFDGVDFDWEWQPSLLAVRAALEARFEAGLYDAIGPPGDGAVDPERMDLALREIADADEGPSLSSYVEREAGVEELREFMIHRSAYQLKEADPHTWAMPRMYGPPKAAIVEIQSDEYGGGRAERIHAQLFADAMDAVELDPTYGAYLDRIPAPTLATVNLMSLFGLHRRWLGAIVGHLALFEMTSSVPNRRYADGVRRLGFDGRATAFFDEHVLADAAHEAIAAVDLGGGLARQQPELGPQVLWGARALDHVEGRWAAAILAAWEAGESSLLPGAAATVRD
ncbi:MAG TPA: iron-containing redox enzyme family protein [Solirubrobacterales bacterium]|nr:iron-containing redox enzyme family protein [Solirubrobacterales bacterium]